MHDGGIVRFFFARLATFVVAHVTFPKGFWCLVFSGMQPQVLVCGTFGLFSRTQKKACCFPVVVSWLVVLAFVLIFNHFNRAG